MTSKAEPLSNESEPFRVLFVCMGNICRSPAAEAVMRNYASATDLVEDIEIDSAGTGGWHAGEPPDERAQAEAMRRGISMSSRARQVHVGDLDYFDLVLAMDEANLTDLLDLATTPEQRGKIKRLREFDPDAGTDLDVPDPYYGGANGFTDVFDIVDAACRGLLDDLAHRARSAP
jgi:protein-tyrosine phosphatase